MLRSQGVEMAIPSRGKFILVNIPSYELIALQDGAPSCAAALWSASRRPRRRNFISSMFAVQFNPAWTPTPSMIRNEGLRYMPPGRRTRSAA